MEVSEESVVERCSPSSFVSLSPELSSLDMACAVSLLLPGSFSVGRSEVPSSQSTMPEKVAGPLPLAQASFVKVSIRGLLLLGHFGGGSGGTVCCETPSSARISSYSFLTVRYFLYFENIPKDVKQRLSKKINTTANTTERAYGWFSAGGGL